MRKNQWLLAYFFWPLITLFIWLMVAWNPLGCALAGLVFLVVYVWQLIIETDEYNRWRMKPKWILHTRPLRLEVEVGGEKFPVEMQKETVST